MAEERLIDRDKDKKYRIRKNADGEDELFIDEGEDEDNLEEVTFVVEGESAEGQGGEVDYPEAQGGYAEEEEQRKREVNALIESARQECAEQRYATAVDYLEKAAEIDHDNGEIYALRLVAYTRDFSDYSRVIVAQEYCDKVKNYTSAQTKAEMLKRASQGLEENIEKLTACVSELNEQNERFKAERAKKFIADRNKASIIYSLQLVVIAVFAALAIYFFANMYSVRGNTNLILAIVFTAISVVLLLVSAFFLRKLLTSCRRVRLNRRNSATQLGRDLLARQAELNAFIAIYNALKG